MCFKVAHDDKDIWSTERGLILCPKCRHNMFQIIESTKAVICAKCRNRLADIKVEKEESEHGVL